MKKNALLRSLLPVAAIFLLFTVVLIGIKQWIQAHGVDFNVLFWGNLILFVAAVLSFVVFSKGISEKNAHAIVRMTYGGMLTRMGICLIATVLYVVYYAGHIDKFAIFGCCIFYFVYTFAEVRMLTRMSKKQSNA